MMGINGIPITLRNPENDADVIKPVFATTRRHPELLTRLKAITSTSIQHDVAQRRADLAQAELQEAAAGDIARVAKDLEKAAQAAFDAQLAYFKAVHDFVVEGFIGAGYKADQAAEYADAIGLEDVSRLQANCLMGGGALDFTKPPPNLG